jgi:hypothetical protein
MDYLRSYNTEINNALTPLENPFLQGFLKLFLIAYGGLIAPQLPSSVLKVFQLVPVKIAILFLIVWTSNHDPAVSILVAVGLFTSLNVLAGRQAFESFVNARNN